MFQMTSSVPTTMNDEPDTKDTEKEPNDEPDDWAEALGTFIDMYFKTPALDAATSPVHDDLIPPGEPRSWDDPSWQTGGPELAAHGSRPKPFLEYSPLRLICSLCCRSSTNEHPSIQHYDGERVETEWASLGYMQEVMAECKGRPTAMLETHDYLDYLRNKHHVFTSEECQHNVRPAVPRGRTTLTLVVGQYVGSPPREKQADGVKAQGDCRRRRPR